MGTESSNEPLLLSSKEDDNSFKPSFLLKSTKYVLKSALWFVFIAWASFLFLVPSNTVNQLYTKLVRATSGSLFGVTGSIFLIYSGPVLIIVFLAIIYIRISGDIDIQEKKNKSASFRLWTFPVIIDGPFGVVTAAELIGILLFGVYIIWAITVYTIKNISLLPLFEITDMGGRNVILLELTGLRFGFIGLICLAFLFLPVARGSVLLQLIDIPFEHATRYHVWLGHLTMLLFTLHGLCYVIGWAIQGRLIQELIAWKSVGIANLPGVISLSAGVLMWVTSLPPVRKLNFELLLENQNSNQLILVLSSKIQTRTNCLREGGFDLDLTYITDNIIAMGFPVGDMSSGLFGYFEGFYRNHMEEVIKFFETHHKDRYKVYNLCSERLYNASLFAGKVACFPFNDHNCPPIHLIPSFCQSAYSWLKEDILNVVVVHCKAGKARTGLMICSLLLFLKFFPTAQECIDYYNQKRCVDGKGLILPSQIRYVKYFERILTDFNGESPPGRRCMLRGFRLHECPYWVRPSITISDHNGILFTTRKHPKTKNLMPEDFWIRAQTKGIIVFALPGERGLTELTGDFKIQFHDRQGDFYCWLNTTMMENRVVLNGPDFDDFDKRKLPVPGFKVEIVMIDYDGTVPEKYKASEKASTLSSNDSSPTYKNPANSNQTKPSSRDQENDNVFSDSDDEDKSAAVSSKSGSSDLTSIPVAAPPPQPLQESRKTEAEVTSLRNNTEQLTLNCRQQSSTSNNDQVQRPISNLDSGDIKAIAADASVFSFGDDEDYESDGL